MPVYKCSNGKWRIGSGACMFTSKEAADRAYAAYLAQKGGDKDAPRRDKVGKGKKG